MITTWSSGQADTWMEESLLLQLREKVRRHPWWRARATLVLGLLRRMGIQPGAKIMDVGCGWGTTLASLEKAGYAVTGLDVSKAALDQLDRPNRLLIEADLTQPFPEDAPRHDAVLATDVIEHLDDDVAAIRQFAQLSRDGGKVIVSVPADPRLFSDFDRVQGHRRRYTPETLRAAFSGAGLSADEVLWWGGSLTWLVRFQRQRRPLPAGVSNLQAYSGYLDLPPWPFPLFLTQLLKWESRRTLAGKAKAGTSLFAIAAQ